MLLHTEKSEQGAASEVVIADDPRPLLIDKVSFDLSLARGLDYYTGVIFEVLMKPSCSQDALAKGRKSDSLSGQVGNIAAGGRYDNLVGMFGKRPTPCIGVSLGVDRIFTILDARRERRTESVVARGIDVYVMATGGQRWRRAAS